MANYGRHWPVAMVAAGVAIVGAVAAGVAIVSARVARAQSSAEAA